MSEKAFILRKDFELKIKKNIYSWENHFHYRDGSYLNVANAIKTKELPNNKVESYLIVQEGNTIPIGCQNSIEQLIIEGWLTPVFQGMQGRPHRKTTDWRKYLTFKNLLILAVAIAIIAGLYSQFFHPSSAKHIENIIENVIPP
jgi:hypothetical protein